MNLREEQKRPNAGELKEKFLNDYKTYLSKLTYYDLCQLEKNSVFTLHQIKLMKGE